VSRRSLLKGLAAAPLSLGLLLGPFAASFGCASPGTHSSGTDVAQQIRALYTGHADAAAIASRSGWTIEQATALLASSTAAHAGGDDLRANLDAHIRDDFAADRMRLVDDWWLADTEIAIAVVVAAERP
jgi:hypothetical protein